MRAPAAPLAQTPGPSEEFVFAPNEHRLYKYKASLDPLKKSLPTIMKNIDFYHGVGPRVSDKPDHLPADAGTRPDVTRLMHDGTGLLKLHRRRVGPPLKTPEVRGPAGRGPRVLLARILVNVPIMASQAL